MASLTRRALTGSALALLPAGFAAASAEQDGRLSLTASALGVARPGPGLHRLGAGGRAPLLFVPKAAPAATGYPLALMLHGATQSGEMMIRVFREVAERNGVALLAPSSSGETWDLRRGPRGADAAAIERALNDAAALAPIDARRLGCMGFSDGASYALSLGLTNGDLFSDVCAFSPGYFAAPAPRGRPRIFIAHGRADPILPFANSQKIAELLRAGGYDVTFRAFGGVHAPDPAAVSEAFHRFLG